MWSRGGDSRNSFPLQPEDNVCCHCCLNHLPQNMLPYSAENGSYHQQCCYAGACLCRCEPRSQVCLGEGLGFSHSHRPCTPSSISDLVPGRIKSAVLGNYCPSHSLNCHQGLFQCFELTIFSLMILISCKKKVFWSVRSKCPWASNEQARRG